MRQPLLKLFLAAVHLGAGAVLSGCGTLLPGHLGGVATRVSPEDYGEILCGSMDLEEYPACISNVLDYFEEPLADGTAADSTSGPFAVVMEGDFYSGTYSSSPFSARFNVSNGANACRGSYNVLTGNQDALFDVYCDDGRSGWADIILDTDGRSGIGKLSLNDGTDGKIVFGARPLGRGRPYPWGDVWTVRADGPSGTGPGGSY